MACILLGAMLDLQGHEMCIAIPGPFTHSQNGTYSLSDKYFMILTFRTVAHASLSRLQQIHEEFAAVRDGDGYPKQAAVLGAPEEDLPSSTGGEPLALTRNWQGFRLQPQPHRSLRPAFIHLRMHTKERVYSKCGRTPWRLLKAENLSVVSLQGEWKGYAGGDENVLSV